MNLRSACCLGLLLVLTLNACSLDSGGGGASGRSGSGGASGGTAGVGTGGAAGVGVAGVGSPQCSTEVCDDRDNDCNGIVDDGSANDVCRFRFPNAESVCARGTCVLGMCLPGFLTCDGDLTNGCETPADLLPCGRCNGCDP